MQLHLVPAQVSKALKDDSPVTAPRLTLGKPTDQHEIEVPLQILAFGKWRPHTPSIGGKCIHSQFS